MEADSTNFLENVNAKYKKPLNTAKKRAWSLFRFALLFGLAYIIIYPLLYMISMAFRSKEDLYNVAVKWIPQNYTLETMKKVLTAMNYPFALLNTVMLSVVTSIILISICAVTAYGLSRFKFKGQGIVFACVLITIIVPSHFFIMPSYLGFRYFHWFGLSPIIKLISEAVSANPFDPSIIDTPLVFFLPAFFGIGIRSGLYIYIFRQFFKGMPKELEEASAIDGCGSLKTFLKIVVPSAVPAFVTTFLFSFVWHWNDYQLSAIYLEKLKPLSAYLVNITGYIYQSETQSGAQVAIDTTQMAIDIQAASLAVIAPVVLIYLFLQKYFTESIERTGLVE